MATTHHTQERIIGMASPDYEVNLLRSFLAFHEKEEYMDVTFVCKNNKKVLGNKLTLSCLSPFLKLLFSQCERDPQMITLMVPEVDQSILSLIFDFLYEGIIFLNNKQLNDFKEVMKLLEITFPGMSITERFKAPPPAPPLLKLPTNIASDSRPSVTLNESDDHLSASRRECDPDPDDDPLDVPDLYYTPQSSSVSSSAGSQKLKQLKAQHGKKKVLVEEDMDNAAKSSTNRGQKSGKKRVRPRVDGQSGKKRALTSKDDKPTQPPKRKRNKARKQTFANIKEDTPLHSMREDTLLHSMGEDMPLHSMANDTASDASRLQKSRMKKV
ncbi:hypothetical protein C0J52_00741 [Blattella germanica]|nr:hypothetical protein C0J52_00741 [Blattella germanica]